MFNELPDELREAVNECARVADGGIVAATGSRSYVAKLFQDEQTSQSSDWDVYFKTDALGVLTLVANGWETGTSFEGAMKEDGDEKPLKFASLRNGELNAIAIIDEDLHRRFELATRLTTELRGLEGKKQRKQLLQAILYGNAYQLPEPEVYVQ